MVQYIHTPWRDRRELLKVRRQFYPSPSTTATATSGSLVDLQDNQDDEDEDEDDDEIKVKEEAAKQHAVSRVSMWMQRGGCPHLIESTALLMAAILSDIHETRTRANSSSYAIRAAYSAAFSRYVHLLSALLIRFPAAPADYPYSRYSSRYGPHHNP